MIDTSGQRVLSIGHNSLQNTRTSDVASGTKLYNPTTIGIDRAAAVQ
jgi:hypothetical protein